MLTVLIVLIALSTGLSLTCAVVAMRRAARAERRAAAHETALRLADATPGNGDSTPAQGRRHLSVVRNIGTAFAAAFAGIAAVLANRSRGVALASAAVSVVGALSLVILTPNSEENSASSQPPRLLPELPTAPSGLPDGMNAPVAPDEPRSDATPAPTSPAAAPTTRAPSSTTSHEQPPATSSTTPPSPTTETETRTAEPTPKEDPPDAYERCTNNPHAPVCVDLSQLARLVDDVGDGLGLTASR